PRLQRAVELAIVGFTHAHTGRRRIEVATDGDHREDPPRVCLFEHSRQVRARTKASGRGTIEVRSAVDHQGLAALREHVLFENRGSGSFAVALVCRPRIASEYANTLVRGQPRIDL